MKNKDIEYKIYKKGFLIESNPFFDPNLIFDCGQCFRFKKTENGFIGVIFENIVVIENLENGYYIYCHNPLDKGILESFLDIKRDYKKIQTFLSKDEIMAPALSFGRGIRILKQDFFETLLSFIISQQNSITKISNTVEKISELFGDKIEFNNKIYYTFPTAERLKDITEEDLAPLRCGYRAKYIIDAIKRVNNGEIDYNTLKSLDYPSAKKTLLTINGVGPKVADCICLFSLGHFDAFPTDTWIIKAMDSLYQIPQKEILEKSKEMFGDYSGIAQQYLFYYLRYNRSKVNNLT
jgi:N-glycosylase/DNA lyase